MFGLKTTLKFVVLGGNKTTVKKRQNVFNHWGLASELFPSRSFRIEW